MATIKILNYTKNPLTTIGEVASICYDTQLKDDKHASRIAKHCINSNHGRNLEFADITISISGISARMGRELMRHTVGTSFLQSSTRYITYDNFDYIIPDNLTSEQKYTYIETMHFIQENYKILKELDCENDITGYVLPLCMDTTIVMKANIRALQHLFNMRLCGRALKEFRDFMKELKQQLSQLDEEWKWISDTIFVPKCVALGYCDELSGSCGIKPLKKNIEFKIKEVE